MTTKKRAVFAGSVYVAIPATLPVTTWETAAAMHHPTPQMAISMQTFFHVSLDGLDYSTEDLTTTHLAHLVMPALLPPVET